MEAQVYIVGWIKVPESGRRFPVHNKSGRGICIFFNIIKMGVTYGESACPHSLWDVYSGICSIYLRFQRQPGNGNLSRRAMETVNVVISTHYSENIHNIGILLFVFLARACNQKHRPDVFPHIRVRLASVEFKNPKALSLLKHSGMASPHRLLWLFIDVYGIVGYRAAGPFRIAGPFGSKFRISMVRCKPLAEGKKIKI